MSFLKNFLNRYRNIFIISRKEFTSFFYSPIFYIVAIAFLIVSAGLFFPPFFLKGNAEMRDYFDLLPMLFLFIMPLFSMRLFSEEFATGSYELLSTLPVTTTEIVLGKYLSSLYFTVLILVPTLFFPVSVELVGDLKWGPVIGSYIGAFFLGATYSSIGIFTSSLTRNQIIAAIVGIAICACFFIVDKYLFFLPYKLSEFFQYLGTDYHYKNFAKGIIDIRDLLFFSAVIFIFTFSARFSIDEKSRQS